MTIAFKPTASSTTIEQNGSAIATLDSNGLTMAAGKTIVGSGVGKVLQVVQNINNSQIDTTSTTYVATNVSATITPSSASSKILIIYNINGDTLINGRYYMYGIFRDGSQISTPANNDSFVYNSGRIQVASVGIKLDSPSSTSALTYTIYGKSGDGGSVRLSRSSENNAITLVEIAG